MRKTLIGTVALLPVVLVAWTPRAADARQSAALPTTVDEAVDRLLRELPADDVDWMR